jgi:uncharacterized protein
MKRMKCPICTDKPLVISERQGIEIDYCPDCRGVWLDRGELDKLMAISAAAMPADTIQRNGVEPRQEFEDSGYRPSGGYRARRKKSWMSEIFD